MVAAARKYKRVVQVGTQRRSTRHYRRGPRAGGPGGIAGQRQLCRDLLLLAHAPPATRPTRTAGQSRLRDVDRPRADAAVQLARPSAQLAGIHGIRQRHRRRHVHPHVRRRPLAPGPRLAKVRQLRRRHLRRQGQQGKHHRHAVGGLRPWRHASGLGPPLVGRRPRPRYQWATILYGDKGTLRISYERYEFTPAGKKEPTLHGEPVLELEQYPEDKTEKDLAADAAVAVRATCVISWPRLQAGPVPLPTSKKHTFQRPPPSWPTCRCDWAAPCIGMRPKAM